MVNVCHITTVHQRYDVRILRKECASLAAHGYDVTLLVADDKQNECINDVKIISINYKAKNHIDRILHTKKLILKKAYELDADIYHFHDPELIPVGIALINKGKKVIYDSHEDTPGDIKDRYWIPKYLRNIISYIFAKYESYAAKRFQAIITVTPFLVNRFKKYNKNTVMVTNYPLINNEKNEVDEFTIKRQVCFTGMVAPIWSHDIVLKALKGSNIQYILAGRVVNDYLSELQENDDDKHIKYLGLLAFDKVSNIHKASIAGMAILKPLPNDKHHEGTLGNQKIFEYMNSGIPVICSNFKLWKEIITKYNCGICVNYDNPEQIREAILDLANNPAKACQMGRNGKSAILNTYNWKTQEKVLINLYETLV